MASKINWIAFILYIGFCTPESFCTTLEPSSESSNFTSLSTGSMHNASDITNTSILYQLTSSPSPEIPTGSQETTHINEELSTQPTLWTTVLLGHQDASHDEYSGTRISGSTLSSLDSDVNSTTSSEGSPTTGSQVPNSRYRLPYLKKHLISEEKLSYVNLPPAKKEVISKGSTDKSVTSSGTSSKKEEMAKRSHHLVTTSNSTPASVSVSANETVESPDRHWGTGSNSSESSDDEFSSKPRAGPEASQAPNHTSDVQGMGRSTQHGESNPGTDDLFQPSSNSSNPEMGNHDFHFEPDFVENALGHSSSLASAEESSNPKSMIHQKGRGTERNGTTNGVVPESEFTVNEGTAYNESNTESSSNESIPVNSPSAYDNTSASSKVETPEGNATEINRKRRSLVVDTEPPKRYITTPDSFSEVVHSLLTDSSDTDGSDTQLLTSTKDSSDSSYANTSHLTAEEQSISSAINPVGRMSSTYALEPAALSKESADTESPVTSGFEGPTSADSGSQNYDDKDILEPSMTENINTPSVASDSNSLEKASLPESAVTSAPPCTDDDETDLESTSEISIKVLPLCVKRKTPKLTLAPSDEGTMSQNETSGASNFKQNSSTKVQSEATSTPVLEVLQDTDKTLSSSTHGSSGAQEYYTENITMSRETSDPSDRVNESGKAANSNLPEPIPTKSSVKKVLAEEVLTETLEEPETSRKLESSEVQKTESMDEKSETELGDEVNQSLRDHSIIITPYEIGNIDSIANSSSNSYRSEPPSNFQTNWKSPAINSPPHQTLTETFNNSSSFDYMSDQSEFLPVISDPISQNFSFLQDFTTKKEFKITEDGSADVSSIYPVVDITDSNNKLPPSDSSSETVVADTNSSEQPVPLKAPEQNISSESLSQISAVENSTTPVDLDKGSNQEANTVKTKSDNSTNMETKIAGVGVKTTVSVSLNVSETNSTDMGKSSFNGTAGPTVTMINLTSSGQKLADEFIKIANSLETASDSPQQPKDAVDSADKSSALPSEQPETTPSPLPPPSTTKRFSIRKPKIRINGGDSESPVSRKPFIVKTPPTRASEFSSPVLIFRQGKTRSGSITSSTTPSTTLRASRIPYVGRPMTGSYGFGNVVFAPEAETTVPTTTEEEVTGDSEDEQVTFPTTSGCDNVVIKVPASIVVQKGINCMVHFKNKHSPEYRIRENRMQKMLEVLYIGSEIAHRMCSVEIEGFHCSPKSRRVTVDYNLYFSKNGSAIERHQLAGIFSGRLDNSTFMRYILDTNGTVFEKPSDYIIVKPTQPTDPIEPPIPQWAIAVIVIGAASLVFIILFGALTVYGRHHMRRRYNGSRLGDDEVDRAIDSREWDDKMATYENLAADGIYDIDDGSFDSAKRPYRD